MPVVFGAKKQEELESSGGKLGVRVCGERGVSLEDSFS